MIVDTYQASVPKRHIRNLLAGMLSFGTHRIIGFYSLMAIPGSRILW